MKFEINMQFRANKLSTIHRNFVYWHVNLVTTFAHALYTILTELKQHLMTLSSAHVHGLSLLVHGAT